jgi:hypothetical protein
MPDVSVDATLIRPACRPGEDVAILALSARNAALLARASLAGIPR